MENIFSALLRRDQRERAREYIKGLQRTPGRKSIRNIAQHSGDSSAEQNLHHFVNGSTWDWQPVRRALAGVLAEEIGETRAWVGYPLVIPKGGSKSVGVQRRFHPEFGRMVSAQWALGLWMAAESGSAPVNWHMEIPSQTGAGAIVPTLDRASTERTGAIVGSLLAQIDPGESARMLVLDARGLDAGALITQLRHVGAPLYLRVAENYPVEVATRSPTPAWHVASAGAALDLSQRGHYAGAGEPVVYSKAKVRLPNRPRADGDLGLWGLDHGVRGRSGTLWLTDVATVHAGSVLRARRLLDMAAATQDYQLEHLGIRDFSGRSLAGWHRHATLVSVAHTIRSLRSAATARGVLTGSRVRAAGA
ncbi:IS701 family transposase [Nocardia noduli]|uniref:IS701 family transposase n=1 Tax=Nocardia noduli TaxID=2815722 RepID=UPI001C228731|nr:transposase [Nocardia noduli]